jgi:uncharacterized protein involved in exopolysaccharide biosynthesis
MTSGSKTAAEGANAVPAADSTVSLLDIGATLVAHWKRLLLLPLAVGTGVYVSAMFMPPGYTAKASFMPPQQQQSGLSAALASLGPLAASLGSQTVRNPADQYVSLMQSTTVMDRIIDRFGLMKVYKSEFRRDARLQLSGSVRISLGKKDGLIYVEADGNSPQLAADLANAHIEELRALMGRLAITEAQQRRAFFETQLELTRDRLTKAQLALQQSGFSQGALRAEPRAAAEGYSKLKAEVTAAEVRVQTMRGYLNEAAPEFRHAMSTLNALRDQLLRTESRVGTRDDDSDYVSKFREFKYQETLFDLFARQYELARVDESREGTLIYVVDSALPPEKQSSPRRARMAASATLLTGMVLVAWLLGRLAIQHIRANEGGRAILGRMRSALSGR